MELLQLEYFRAVARRQHVTQAAAELSVAQPSLSRTIARLERELGVPLFDRHGRQLRLNRFGQTFLGSVERALAELDEGRRMLHDMAGLERAHIALSATTLRWMPELLRSFREQHPGITFRLNQADRLAMRQQLYRGECDLALATQPFDCAELESVAVLHEQLLLAVPVGHRLAGGGSIDLADAALESFISLKPGYDMRDLTIAFCQQAGFTPRLACEVDEPAAIRPLVRAGLGVAFLPSASWLFNSEPDPVALRISRPVCERTLVLAWRRGRYQSAAVRAFRQFVVDYFADQVMSSSRTPAGQMGR